MCDKKLIIESIYINKYNLLKISILYSNFRISKKKSFTSCIQQIKMYGPFFRYNIKYIKMNNINWDYK